MPAHTQALGLAHPTVVPTNFERSEEDHDRRESTDGEA